MTIRAIAAESKVELFEARIKDKDQVIDATNKTVTILEDQLKRQTENRVDAGRIFTIDQARVEACQAQLAKADARIHSLEHPGLLKSIFDVKSATGFMFGYGAGRLQNSFTK